MSKKILVINPGSTSTKIAVFDDEKELFEDTLRHAAEDLSPYHTIAEQTPFRTQLTLMYWKKEALTEERWMRSPAEAEC